VAWFNAKVQYGADSSGAVDATVAIQNAINAAKANYGGGIVYLPTGGYKVSAPLNMTGCAGVSIRGDLQSSWLFPTAAFSGAAVIIVTAGNVNSVEDLLIQFPSNSYASNPAADGIDVAHSNNFRAINIDYVYGNGYAVSILSDSTGNSLFPVLHRIHEISSKGGINIQGTPASNNGFYGSMTECVFDTTGSNPAINFQDAYYFNVNKVTSVSAAGPGISISGLSSQILISDCNVGPFSGAAQPTLLVQPSGGNTPTDVYISNSVFQAGNYAGLISGVNRMGIVNCSFMWAQSHGLAVSGSVGQLGISNCEFTSNGQNAGTNYDLSYAGSGYVAIAGCTFNSAIGTGAGQVTAAINFASGTSVIGNCVFAKGSAYANFPTYSYSNIGDKLSNFQDVLANDMYFTEQAALPAARGTTDILYADNKSRPTWWSQGNPPAAIWNLDRSQTDATAYTANTTGALPLTKAYTVDAINGIPLASAYLLKTWFIGNWGTAFNISVNLSGTVTHIASIAQTFASAVVSGDAVSGWIEAMVMPINSTTARVQIAGSITDTAQGAGAASSITTSFSANSGNLPFSGGVIGIQGYWAGTSSGQNVQTIASTFTRRG
jgi:hypothetical protein